MTTLMRLVVQEKQKAENRAEELSVMYNRMNICKF